MVSIRQNFTVLFDLGSEREVDISESKTRFEGKANGEQFN
jgi:hypothetical protein